MSTFCLFFFCMCSSSYFQAIDSIHQVGVYCLALVPANTLPKAPLGGIHISETKQRFLEGALHPCNVLMCPHTCVTNLPKPRQKQPGRLPVVPVRTVCTTCCVIHEEVICLCCLIIPAGINPNLSHVCVVVNDCGCAGQKLVLLL